MSKSSAASGDDARRPLRDAEQRARIEHIGTPSELYENPGNLFVASFIGSPEMNLIRGTCREWRVHRRTRPAPATAEGGRDRQGVVYGIHPQHIAVGGSHAKARVQVVEPTGEAQEITLTADGIDLMAEIREQPVFKPGQKVNLEIVVHKVHLFDARSGIRIN
ncbi:TOBE domain-containing protein [Mesorhizobium sp. B2-4-19]|uniref:TOBE domain-containing protein n=1 Tax=Mesorhizobium sp. B2-4-19 TaxID=2589930 RepID=UPI0015E31866|nr:TOBE domain-containing protein [Mesorhizobium sp. B2-4-19]